MIDRKNTGNYKSSQKAVVVAVDSYNASSGTVYGRDTLSN